MDHSNQLICVLMYGNYHATHRRLIRSLLLTLCPNQTVWVWLNQVCQPTYDELAKHTAKITVKRVSSDNVPKYRVMRQFYDEITPEQFKWVLWLDDDTHFTRPDALEAAQKFQSTKAGENVCYFGEKWWVNYLAGQSEFISRSPWYKGRPFELVGKKKVPGINFITGGYHWLRTDVLKQLDWPDKRLVHNGGDTLLAEAIRQQGLPIHHFNYGVKVNDAKRRGRSDAPAGCTNPSERR